MKRCCWLGVMKNQEKLKFIWSRSDFVIRYRSRRDVSSRSMAYILLVDGSGPRSWLRDWRCCCCEFQGSALMGDRHISDDPSSHHLPAVCLYWIRIHQIWDSRAGRPI
jgi:hypothetical protein